MHDWDVRTRDNTRRMKKVSNSSKPYPPSHSTSSPASSLRARARLPDPLATGREGGESRWVSSGRPCKPSAKGSNTLAPPFAPITEGGRAHAPKATHSDPRLAPPWRPCRVVGRGSRPSNLALSLVAVRREAGHCLYQKLDNPKARACKRGCSAGRCSRTSLMVVAPAHDRRRAYHSRCGGTGGQWRRRLDRHEGRPGGGAGRASCSIGIAFIIFDRRVERQEHAAVLRRAGAIRRRGIAGGVLRRRVERRR